MIRKYDLKITFLICIVIIMSFNQKEYQKEYREKNKEKHKEYCKEYYKKNKEKLIKNQLERDSLRKDEIKKYVRTPARLKSSRIRHWREYDVRYHGSWDELHDLYDNTKFCQLCNYEFVGDNKNNNYQRKVLEHDHLSKCVRSICCQGCNMQVAKIDRKRYILLLELHRYFNQNIKQLENHLLHI